MSIRAEHGLLLALLLLGACGERSAQAPDLPPPTPVAPTTVEAAAPLDPDVTSEAGSDEDMWAEFESGQSPMVEELVSERALQLTLPTADGPQWAKLRKTSVWVDEPTQLFRARHPAEVRALAGKPFKIQGFMLPLEMAERTTRFLISPYTPVCFYHPPAEPNEVIEVWLKRPIRAGYHLVEVEGVLTLTDNGEKGLFFQIHNGAARVVQEVEGGL
ncbi:MAG: DUF3299 domain-containing protein [Phenylobacterium sp.]|uniref:DUF3299 domain-containing protein n=1 Tax=Phenylobacterium sp. TaxID=1871053 RepID=UPI00272523B0|nr:DUF3299 domain-containing protein [Phenylobacterium sp.]MDO8901971.1 DUF3299 domain-containing protein [Phenylobacterium sp.]